MNYDEWFHYYDDPEAPTLRTAFAKAFLGGAVDDDESFNDALRMLTGEGRIVFTAGITALPPNQQAAILDRVFAYTDFTPESDPYGEHDFGSFEHAGKTIFWKIDAYDRALTFGSPDPADEAVTTRVLTVMLAQEY